MVTSTVLFLERENDEILRDFIFNFFPFENKNFRAKTTWLNIIISYIITLGAKHTQMCFFKWIMVNYNKETMICFFKDLIKDHVFRHNTNNNKEIQNFTSMATVCPELAFLFISVNFDILSNQLQDCEKKYLELMIDIFEIWMSSDSLRSWFFLVIHQHKNNEILLKFGETLILSLQKILLTYSMKRCLLEEDTNYGSTLNYQETGITTNIRSYKKIESRVHLLALHLIHVL